MPEAPAQDPVENVILELKDLDVKLAVEAAEAPDEKGLKKNYVDRDTVSNIQRYVLRKFSEECCKGFAHAKRFAEDGYLAAKILSLVLSDDDEVQARALSLIQIMLNVDVGGMLMSHVPVSPKDSFSSETEARKLLENKNDKAKSMGAKLLGIVGLKIEAGKTRPATRPLPKESSTANINGPMNC